VYAVAMSRLIRLSLEIEPEQHRLVYKVEADVLIVLQAKGHY